MELSWLAVGRLMKRPGWWLATWLVERVCDVMTNDVVMKWLNHVCKRWLTLRALPFSGRLCHLHVLQIIDFHPPAVNSCEGFWKSIRWNRIWDEMSIWLWKRSCKPWIVLTSAPRHNRMIHSYQNSTNLSDGFTWIASNLLEGKRKEMLDLSWFGFSTVVESGRGLTLLPNRFDYSNWSTSTCCMNPQTNKWIVKWRRILVQINEVGAFQLPSTRLVPIKEKEEKQKEEEGKDANDSWPGIEGRVTSHWAPAVTSPAKTIK